MQGYQITFYTRQDRNHGTTPLGQWLLELAQELAIGGATLNGAVEGLGHDGRLHAITMFDQSEQPLQVIMIVSQAEKARLLQRLQQEKVSIFYVAQAVEYGFS
ncbi:hypothetical protein DLM_1327 [Aquitalea magnusonii]|uniref:Uncharacterized protein n=1 Tax=Aquitalea magnusonii TaxID=332411 RepID=A0A3G9GFC3_9NEIS|nr:DUF190 domain-containing protein [Aquitalea magnusonii]BBF84951.1 hypothetical protein DLM_1327 [Aquitalea magnusonii]